MDDTRHKLPIYVIYSEWDGLNLPMFTFRLNQNRPLSNVYWVTLYLLVLLTACSSPPSDADLITSQLHDMAKAAAVKDSKVILRNLTEDFVGNQSLRRSQMHALMYSYFQRNKVITVTMTDIHITVQDQQAEGALKLILTGSDQIVPERLRWLQVDLSWRKTQDGWQINAASWRDVSTQD